ncbi:zinc finger protein 569-like [Thalassophryne amazonica]|uniref:zinc finger protein 569-like n=1 Tax=Thalassophryne amazonica TaxID=390379 RepID=UPI001470B6CC|nr:zinc finger protein 569-like [Thalassophryne amazonica]
MSTVQMLRALLKQRLPADDEEEIFELLERTTEGYEEELCRLEEENEAQRQLLEAVCNSEVWLRRTDDVQQPMVIKEEESPEDQAWSCSYTQVEPAGPQIKEENEELWTSEGQEHFHELSDMDIIQFPFTHFAVEHQNDRTLHSSEIHHCPAEKNSDSEPQASSSTEQMKTKYRADSGVSEPANSLAVDINLPPHIDVMLSQSSESETEVSDVDDWKVTRQSQSNLKFLKNHKLPLNISRSNDGPKEFTCLDCGQAFGRKDTLRVHLRTHTGEKPFSCSKCGQSFSIACNLKEHMRTHTGEKPFSCSDCGQRFFRKVRLKEHLLTHSGEKPFSCSDCGQKFGRKDKMRVHMKSNTVENPVSCSECGQLFTMMCSLKSHMRIHKEDTPCICLSAVKDLVERAT